MINYVFVKLMPMIKIENGKHPVRIYPEYLVVIQTYWTILVKSTVVHVRGDLLDNTSKKHCGACKR